VYGDDFCPFRCPTHVHPHYTPLYAVNASYPIDSVFVNGYDNGNAKANAFDGRSAEEFPMVVEAASTMTIAEAARRADMHPNSLRYWIERGVLKTHATPLGRLVDRQSFEDFVSARKADKAIATR